MSIQFLDYSFEVFFAGNADKDDGRRGCARGERLGHVVNGMSALNRVLLNGDIRSGEQIQVSRFEIYLMHEHHLTKSAEYCQEVFESFLHWLILVALMGIEPMFQE